MSRKRNKKDVISMDSYKVIFNKLENWKFPDWQKESLLGCANLLVEQSRALSPYLLPLFKAINSHSLYNNITLYVMDKIQENGALHKVLNKFKNWIQICPFLENDNQHIGFSPIENQELKHITWFNKQYCIIHHGLFKQTNTRRQTKPKNRNEWQNVWNLIQSLGDYSIKIVEKKQGNDPYVLLIFDTQKSKKDNVKTQSIYDRYRYSNPFVTGDSLSMDYGDPDERPTR